MNNLDQQPPEFAQEDDIQITDLDLPGSPQQKRAARILNLARAGLARPQVRYSLSAVLLLILSGAFLLQLARFAPAATSSTPTASSVHFLSAASMPGLVFIQNTDYTLTAYQSTTGRALWHSRLPAVSTIEAGGQALYCYFWITINQTQLEALDKNTGKMLWQDDLPATPATLITGQISAPGTHTSQGPAFSYNNNTLYIHSSDDTIYALQASTGHINWAHHTKNSPTPASQSSNNLAYGGPFGIIGNSVIEFSSSDSTLHFLDINTGQEILALPLASSFLQYFIDGQIIYLLPFPNSPPAPVQAFHIPDGRLLWTHPLPAGAWGQTVANGIIYIGADSGYTLIALRGSDGHQIWTYRASDGQPITNSFFVANDTGYLFQQDATLVGIRTNDGQVLWRSQIATLKNHITLSTTLTTDNGHLILYDSQNLPGSLIYILNASDGHLLWNRSGFATTPAPFNGNLYVRQNNGRLDAWRESDGQHLWSFDAPIGTAIVGYSAEDPLLLFLLDPIGTFYVLRSSDGHLLWRYPS